MRILEIITPSKIAGAERSTMLLCHGLEAAGHQVWLMTKEGHPLVEIAAGEGLRVVSMKIAGKLNVPAPFRIARFAREHRIDLINTHLSTASVWGSMAGKLARIPVVCTVRALNHRAEYLLADHIIAVSNAVKQHLVDQRTPAEMIDVVYNGVDLKRFIPPADVKLAKAAVGLHPDHLVVGVIAHLSKKKGHAWFLEAAARVTAQAPNARFLLLGDGPEREALQAQAKALGIDASVIFAGFHQDVVPWIAAMDVMVLPSIAMEGLGRVLFEAGALAKPVIGTTVGGAPEVVAHDRTGYIVKPHDIPTLAEMLVRLLRDDELRLSMGKAGRRRTLDLFTEDSMVKNTLEVFKRLLEMKGRAIEPDPALQVDQSSTSH